MLTLAICATCGHSGPVRDLVGVEQWRRSSRLHPCSSDREPPFTPQPKPVTTCRPVCRGLPQSGSLGQCAKITPAVCYLNKDNTILADIFLVSNDVAAEFFVESASALVLSKDPQARRPSVPTLLASLTGLVANAPHQPGTRMVSLQTTEGRLGSAALCQARTSSARSIGS
jgi:hypothetical protein